MTEDSIFLILSTNYYVRIYEDVEKNRIRKWSYVWDFEQIENDFFFPPVIQPIENGKFIFFPAKDQTELS